MKALAIADARHYQRFISQQIHYTLHSREAEYELVPIAIDQGVNILVWSPIAGGLLSGKFRRGVTEPEGARHSGGHAEPPVYDWDKLYDIIDVIVSVAEEHRVSGAQVALAWLLQRPGVASVIIGGRTEAQFKDNLAAANLKLTEHQVKRLNEVSQPTLIYPYWHQNWSVYDRMSKADLAYHSGYPRPQR
jgi:aryl-alcohol dehydrogenase-like predicted oxidoreductase